MSEKRIITLKKSALATYKAMGENNKSIADRYGISSTEVNDAMVEFGFVKSRKKTSGKDYIVEFVDDVTLQTPTIQTNLLDEIEATTEEMTEEYDTPAVLEEDSNF